MRKKLAVLIAVITAAMMLFGCGGKDMSGSEYLGKWKATKAEYAGIEVGVDTVFDEFHFTLQDNGKVKLNVNGDETTGKWETALAKIGEGKMKKEDFVAKVRLAITKQIERGKEIG